MVRFAVKTMCVAGAALGVLGLEPADAQFRYDDEYPSVAYSSAPTDNPVARLQERLASGEIELEHRPGRGYLDSLLEALDISPSSQVLVFSKTSIQQELIRPEEPRAIYFNDDAYVGWVQSSNLLEFATMDAGVGPMFYVLENDAAKPPAPERLNERCLTCHDTQGMMGGGVPLLMVRSSFVGVDGLRLVDEPALATTDATPLEQRWGGWYVTGRHGDQVHRGNILLSDASELAELEARRRGNLDTLEGAGLFDTDPYLVPTSDIVALMVLEHQVTVQNQIAYVRYKAPFVLERTGYADHIDAASWDALPPEAQRLLTRMHEELVARLLLKDAIVFDEPISGSETFAESFEARGPWDDEGRSLRELDLETQLFKRPLSYLIYSNAFDRLPGYTKDYVYQRLAQVLDGSDQSEAYAHVSAEDRRALRDILIDTKPDFVRYVGGVEG